jgi:ferredoxin
MTPAEPSESALRWPVVDEELCLGYGFCETIASSVFRVDASNLAHVQIRPEDVQTAETAAIELAIAQCPMQAIAWSTTTSNY